MIHDLSVMHRNVSFDASVLRTAAVWGVGEEADPASSLHWSVTTHLPSDSVNQPLSYSRLHIYLTLPFFHPTLPILGSELLLKLQVQVFVPSWCYTAHTAHHVMWQVAQTEHVWDCSYRLWVLIHLRCENQMSCCLMIRLQGAVISESLLAPVTSDALDLESFTQHQRTTQPRLPGSFGVTDPNTKTLMCVEYQRISCFTGKRMIDSSAQPRVLLSAGPIADPLSSQLFVSLCSCFGSNRLSLYNPALEKFLIQIVCVSCCGSRLKPQILELVLIRTDDVD